jgi:signal transduction histidine kinase
MTMKTGGMTLRNKALGAMVVLGATLIACGVSFYLAAEDAEQRAEWLEQSSAELEDTLELVQAFERLHEATVDARLGNDADLEEAKEAVLEVLEEAIEELERSQQVIPDEEIEAESDEMARLEAMQDLARRASRDPEALRELSDLADATLDDEWQDARRAGGSQLVAAEGLRTLVTLFPGAAALVVILMMVWIGPGLFRRISALQGATERMTGGEDGVRVPVSGSDELTALSLGFNEMSSRLESSRAQLVEQAAALTSQNEQLAAAMNEIESTQSRLIEVSRQAGKAEVAAGVLHNVGNVLNSVNVSVGVISQKLGDLRLARMEQAVGMLDRPAAELATFLGADPRGGKVVPFLKQACERLSADVVACSAELGELQKHVEHMKHVVARQQSYAKKSGVLEVVRPAAIVNDALSLHRAAIDGAAIEVVRHDEGFEEVPLDRHRVLQVLINLVGNAKQALEQRDGGRRIVIATRVADGQAIFDVIDNGKGITAENLTKIFQHGFTTRAQGHGFGLHVSALAATEMGGKLECESDGPGKGARFTLVLPIRETKALKPRQRFVTASDAPPPPDGGRLEPAA